MSQPKTIYSDMHPACASVRRRLVLEDYEEEGAHLGFEYADPHTGFDPDPGQRITLPREALPALFAAIAPHVPASERLRIALGNRAFNELRHAVRLWVNHAIHDLPQVDEAFRAVNSVLKGEE